MIIAKSWSIFQKQGENNTEGAQRSRHLTGSNPNSQIKNSSTCEDLSSWREAAKNNFEKMTKLDETRRKRMKSMIGKEVLFPGRLKCSKIRTMGFGEGPPGGSNGKGT